MIQVLGESCRCLKKSGSDVVTADQTANSTDLKPMSKKILKVSELLKILRWRCCG